MNSRRNEVKKVVFTNLALLLGGLGASSAWGQYPGAYGALGPSAYPVQTQQVIQGLPQVPQSYVAQTYVGQYPAQPAQSAGWQGQRPTPYQLIANPDQNGHSLPAPQSILNNSPAVIAGPTYGDTGHQQMVNPGPVVHGQPPAYQAVPSYQPAPANTAIMNPVYGQTIAPGCSSCGSAPIAESYGYPMQGGVYAGPDYGGQMGGPFAGAARQSFFTGMPMGAKPFFGGGNVLIFQRIDDDNRELTYNVNMPTDNFLGTRDARFGTMGGFEVFLGRYFNCGRNAISAGYWGLFPGDRTAMVTTAGGADLRSRYHFNGILMPAIGIYPQDTVYNWYDLAVANRIVRTSNYHNIEVNLLGFTTGGAARSFYLPTSGTMFSGARGARGGCGYCGGAGCGMCSSANACGCGGHGSCGGSCGSSDPNRFATGPCCLAPGCGSRLNMTWLAGVRYFRFNDTLSYASSRLDNQFTGANDDIYWDTQLQNDLLGAQLGGIINYCTGRRANLYATTKMGVYGNRSQYDTSIGGIGTAAYVSSTNAFNGQNFVVSSSKTDVAFIGEVGTGVNIRLSSKWSANVGYRAIAASVVATAVDQIPLEMIHLGNVANFDNNGSLILHGLTLGGLYNY
jgi:Putative beta barrel porin-7 (BBP7)